MIKVIRVISGTIVDGLGLRTSIYLAGCGHHCKGCHNKESWNPDPKEYRCQADDSFVNSIVDSVNSDPLIQGLTFSGGDPLYNPPEFLTLLKKFVAKLDPCKSIWIYTGYTFDMIISDKIMREVAEIADVIVDGPFMQELKDPELLFRGSSNQRLVKSKESIKNNKIILLEV